MTVGIYRASVKSIKVHSDPKPCLETSCCKNKEEKNYMRCLNRQVDNQNTVLQNFFVNTYPTLISLRIRKRSRGGLKSIG